MPQLSEQTCCDLDTLLQHLFNEEDWFELSRPPTDSSRKRPSPVGVESLFQESHKVEPIFFIKAFRKGGRYLQWSEKSSVRFSEYHQVGKIRKFVIDGVSPDSWLDMECIISIHAVGKSKSDFYLSKQDRQVREALDSLSLPLHNGYPAEFYLHLQPKRSSPPRQEHYLQFDFHSCGRLVYTYTLKHIFSAGHKHESGKAQVRFYEKEDSMVEINLAEANGNVIDRIAC